MDGVSSTACVTYEVGAGRWENAKWFLHMGIGVLHILTDLHRDIMRSPNHILEAFFRVTRLPLFLFYFLFFSRFGLVLMSSLQHRPAARARVLCAGTVSMAPFSVAGSNFPRTLGICFPFRTTSYPYPFISEHDRRLVHAIPTTYGMYVGPHDDPSDSRLMAGCGLIVRPRYCGYCIDKHKHQTSVRHAESLCMLRLERLASCLDALFICGEESRDSGHRAQGNNGDERDQHESDRATSQASIPGKLPERSQGRVCAGQAEIIAPLGWWACTVVGPRRARNSQIPSTVRLAGGARNQARVESCSGLATSC